MRTRPFTRELFSVAPRYAECDACKVSGVWGWLLVAAVVITWDVVAWQTKKVEYLSKAARRHRIIDAVLTGIWAWHTLKAKGRRDG